MNHFQAKLINQFIISQDSREYFLENLSMQLSSGMDVVQAIDGIVDGAHGKGMRMLLKQLRYDINSGLTLWESIDRVAFLSHDMLALVRIGEEVGRLPQNLDVIVIQTQKQRDFRSRLRSAMMYPIFVFGLTLVVGVGVAWFILPRLADVFESLNVTLPTVTKWLIAVGRFFGTYGTTAVPLIVFGLAIIILIVFVIKPTKIIGQTLLFALPGVNKLLLQVELSRLGYILGTLLDAGLPIVDSIYSLSGSTSMYRYKKFYKYLAKSVKDGNSLSNSFKEYSGVRKIIPSPVQQMINAGELSGNLPKTLLRIGKTFESKSETSTKNLSTVLEPILLVVVWIGVMVVAVAVVLPVYSLIGQLDV